VGEFGHLKRYLRIKLSELMRTVAHIAHPLMRITVNHWNSSYQLTYELDAYTQVYKLADDEVSLDDVKSIGKGMADEALKKFIDMRSTLSQHVKTNQQSQ